ncbi:MAG: aconitase X swivel domain-containing protein [Thermoprotei archaeon]|nr:DUF126 domain-containing protein [TACK group archaeon]
MKAFRGKVAVEGMVDGMALVSRFPLSFLGGVNPATGQIIDHESDVFGEFVTGKILIYPTGKGSTVGSYVIYGMKKVGTAPAAMVLVKPDPVTTIGCVISGIPMLHSVEAAVLSIKQGSRVRVSKDVLEVLSNEARSLPLGLFALLVPLCLCCS